MAVSARQDLSRVRRQPSHQRHLFQTALTAAVLSKPHSLSTAPTVSKRETNSAALRAKHQRLEGCRFHCADVSLPHLDEYVSSGNETYDYAMHSCGHTDIGSLVQNHLDQDIASGNPSRKCGGTARGQCDDMMLSLSLILRVLSVSADLSSAGAWAPCHHSNLSSLPVGK